MLVVRWLDARSDSCWQDPEKLNETLAEITTVGFLIKETDEILIMADSIDSSTGNVSEITYIPAKCVQSQTQLMLTN